MEHSSTKQSKLYGWGLLAAWLVILFAVAWAAHVSDTPTHLFQN